MNQIPYPERPDAVTACSPVHMIGIGGAGMSALAELTHHLGYTVQGSDRAENQATTRLVGRGVRVSRGHDKSHAEGAGLVVYSSAIPPDNPELWTGAPTVHRSVYLRTLMRGKCGITVAGTHGKTTTTAMAGHVLHGLGDDPTVVAGGHVPQFGGGSLCGSGPAFVAEADESDGSILEYHPTVGVVTSCDADHLDRYGAPSAIAEVFIRHLHRICPSGCAVLGLTGPNMTRVQQHCPAQVITYGPGPEADLHVRGWRAVGSGTEFTLAGGGQQYEGRLRLPGFHNIMNALAAVAVAQSRGHKPSAALDKLAEFRGVDRRLTERHTSPGLTVIDAFAHNPGKIRAAVAAVHSSWPDHEVRVIYQPHRYSRLEHQGDELAAAFAGVAHVSVLPVYSAGEAPRPGLDSTWIAGLIQTRSRVPTEPIDEDLTTVKLGRRRPIVLLLLAAGDTQRLYPALERLLGIGLYRP